MGLVASSWLSQVPSTVQIATDYLSIPSTSCDNKRAFSKANRTITCDRNSLSEVTIEGIHLLKDWILHGVVKSSLIDRRKSRGAAERKATQLNRIFTAKTNLSQSATLYARYFPFWTVVILPALSYYLVRGHRTYCWKHYPPLPLSHTSSVEPSLTHASHVPTLIVHHDHQLE